MAEKKEPLSVRKKSEQVLVLAQLCRNQFAIDFALGVISNIKDSKEYTGKIKVRIRLFEEFAERYNTDLQNASKERGILEDPMRDAAYEFGRYVKDALFYYRESSARACQELRIDDANILAPVIMAKDVLGVTAMIAGMEARVSQACRCFTAFGGVARVRVDGQGDDSEATTMGSAWQMMRNILRCMAKGRCETEPGAVIYECTNNDNGRAIMQSSETLIKAMTWYSLFEALCVRQGVTIEEAVKTAKEMDAQNERRRRQEEKRKTLKAAKVACKTDKKYGQL